MAEIMLAGCVIRDPKKRILLLHRKNPEQWELPGGKVEAGEDPRDAACREIDEETRCKVEVKHELGGASFVEGDETFHYIWFEAEIQGPNEPVVGEPEKFDEVSYWSIKELRGLPLSPNMRNLLHSGHL